MIAADTSSMISYLSGDKGADVTLLAKTIRGKRLALPSPVLAELLSDHNMPGHIRQTLLGLPLLDLKPAYWQRVGDLRASILKSGRKARLADTLIAQNCLDHNVPLITRDSDFRHMVADAGLKVLP